MNSDTSLSAAVPRTTRMIVPATVVSGRIAPVSKSISRGP
jgi:hypothetical protein